MCRLTGSNSRRILPPAILAAPTRRTSPLQTSRPWRAWTRTCKPAPRPTSASDSRSAPTKRTSLWRLRAPQTSSATPSLGFLTTLQPTPSTDNKETISRPARVTLPDGFAASVANAAQCSDADFGVGNYLKVPSNVSCTRAIVGTGFVRVSTELFKLHIVMGGLQGVNPAQPLFVGGIIYNLAPTPDEFARLGLVISGVSAKPRQAGGSRRRSRRRFGTTGRHRDGRAPRDLSRQWNRHRHRTAEGPSGHQRVQPTARALPRVHRHADLGFCRRSPDPHTDTPTTPKPGLTADFAENGTDCSTTARARVAISTYNGTQAQRDSQATSSPGAARSRSTRRST